MIDLALDPLTKDLLIQDLDLKIISQTDFIKQSLEVRLKFFLGEWFLDTEAGTPLYQDIFTKNPDLPKIESILKARILETSEVKELLEFDLVLNNDRSADVTFKVNTNFGIVEFSETIFD